MIVGAELGLGYYLVLYVQELVLTTWLFPSVKTPTVFLTVVCFLGDTAKSCGQGYVGEGEGRERGGRGEGREGWRDIVREGQKEGEKEGGHNEERTEREEIEAGETLLISSSVPSI